VPSDIDPPLHPAVSSSDDVHRHHQSSPPPPPIPYTAPHVAFRTMLRSHHSHGMCSPIVLPLPPARPSHALGPQPSLQRGSR
jgi:hypothetical protein